jgi:hypothetical protein
MNLRFVTSSCLILACLALHRATAAADDLRVSIAHRPHLPSTCSARFIPHDLPYVTTTDTTPIRLYDSNGAGLAIGDLNADGLLEIVLANLSGGSSILWNTAALTFRPQRFAEGVRARGIAILDVEADGRPDIVLTSGLTAPTYWHNEGDGRFSFRPLNGVRKPAYAMNWADLDADGDVDLVAGSYDAELEKRLGNTFLLQGGAGVYLYENQGIPSGSSTVRFKAKRLAATAQALAILVTDLTGDGHPEIIIGNDFAVPDMIWTREGPTWRRIEPFAATPHSTMSFDVGDLGNDGQAEIFAADMQPYSDDPSILRSWQPILDQLEAQPKLRGDRQVVENVLLTKPGATARHVYLNTASALGVRATGWTWAAKFGDLDSDGYLDLYAVNGMIAAELFGALPNAELVEQNQVLRNEAATRFVPMPGWGLGSERSGRGMSMADLDQDGDLDIVVNNLGSPTQLFENQLCGGANLTLTLHREDAPNPSALGARVTLYTSTGTYQRDVRAISGYLSGDPPQVHLGFPQHSTLHSLEIAWGDGVVTRLARPAPNVHLSVTRQRP